MFAKLIRSSESVRRTFDGIAGVNLWWRIVLSLHGKPSDCAVADRRIILKRGFHFYGWLYLSLAVPFLCIGMSSLLVSIPELGVLSYLSILGSIYLACSSQLAFKGANDLYAGNERGAPLLVAFFVAVLVFLAAFMACVLMYASNEKLLPNSILTVLFCLMLLFGGGSYMIEVLYLVWLPMSEPDEAMETAEAQEKAMKEGDPTLGM